MARTVEDVFARRLILLFLGAKASIEIATIIVSILVKELNKNDDWRQEQISNFIEVASQYVIKN